SLDGDRASLLVAASYWAERGLTERARLAVDAADQDGFAVEEALLRASLYARQADCTRAGRALYYAALPCRTWAQCSQTWASTCSRNERPAACPVLVAREVKVLSDRCGALEGPELATPDRGSLRPPTL